MDYDSSSKFISSLAKFLQSLCNGYVEFDSGVHVIGHLYLSVDTGKTIDYILNEKVCKTDENSVTFISNSFHAQPAEKPKPPGKKQVRDPGKTDAKIEDDSENYIAELEPRSTNVGTLPQTHSASQNSPVLQGTKRPYSPPQKQLYSKSGRMSPPRHKKNRTELLDHGQTPVNENSISSVPSPAEDADPSNTMSSRNSDVLHGSQLNESYQQNYFQPEDEGSLADDSEERDIKPSIDTDVTFIKEEFTAPTSCSQSDSQSRERTHSEDSYPYQSNQMFPGGFPTQGGFTASSPRLNFNSASAHMFSPGQSSSHHEENSGDPSASARPTNEMSYRYYCDICSAGFNYSHNLMRHKRCSHGVSEKNEWFYCHICSLTFARKDVYKRHLKAQSHVFRSSGLEIFQQDNNVE